PIIIAERYVEAEYRGPIDLQNEITLRLRNKSHGNGETKRLKEICFSGCCCDGRGFPGDPRVTVGLTAVRHLQPSEPSAIRQVLGSKEQLLQVRSTLFEELRPRRCSLLRCGSPKSRRTRRLDIGYQIGEILRNCALFEAVGHQGARA